MAKRLRKKPIEVDAEQWTGDNLQVMVDFTYGCDPARNQFRLALAEDRANDPAKDAAVYDDLHSAWVPLATGDWVVKGVKGEFYPIVPGVLAETYDEVDV